MVLCRGYMSLMAWLILAPLPSARSDPQTPRTDLYGDPLPAGAVVRLGSTRLRHGGSVTALAYSPDGKLLASASNDDNQVMLWEMPSGKRLHQFTVPGTDSNYLVFSWDGTLLASSGGRWGHPKVIQVWEVASGKELLKVPDNQAPFTTNVIAFSPDGKTIAMVKGGQTVQVWDLATGKVIRTYDKVAGSVRALTFTPEGKLLALAVEDKKNVCLWELTAAKKLHTVEVGREIFTPIAFSSDGRSVAFEAADRIISVRDAAMGKELHRLEGHTKNVYSLTFSTDGKTLASGSWDATIRLWDLERGKERLQVGTVPGGLPFAALSPDGKCFATGGANSPHAVLLWDATTGKPLDPFSGHTSPVYAIAVSPDGKLTATAAWLRGDPAVRVWESATGRLIREFRGHEGGVFSAVFSPDGKRLASCGWGDHTVRIWDVQTAKELHVLRGHPAGVKRVVFSPDGKWLASGDAYYGQTGAYDGRVRVWDAATGKLHHELQGHGGAIQALAFTPDNRTLLVGAAGIHYWDVTTGHRQGDPLMVQGGFWDLAVSPDGKVMATAGNNRPVRLWEVPTRQEILQLPAEFTGNSVAFAPNGRALAVGTKDVVRLFHWPTEQAERPLTGHRGTVAALVFSPDGNHLFSGSSWETSTLVWDVASVVKRPIPKTEREDFDLWLSNLRVGNPAAAYRGVWLLASAPERALPLLRASVKPAAAADVKKIARLIVDLDSDRFEVREKASQELDQLGEVAEGALQQALKGKPSAEQRRRIEDLLEKLKEPLPGSERLGNLRAIIVLEQIATAEARRYLEELANGAPGMRLTQDAKSALERLTRRPAAP